MKFMITFSIIFYGLNCGAQNQKGNIFIGGVASAVWNSAGVTNPDIQIANPGDQPTPQTGSTLIFTFNPQVGFFISSKSAIGGGINYTRGKNPQYGITSSYSASIDVFHRLYVPITNNVYFILHSQLAGGFGKQNDRVETEKTSAFSVIVNPTFAFFPSPHWSLEASFGSVGLTTNNTKFNGDHNNNTSVYFKSGLNLGLGVFYYLNRAPK